MMDTQQKLWKPIKTKKERAKSAVTVSRVGNRYRSNSRPTPSTSVSRRVSNNSSTHSLLSNPPHLKRTATPTATRPSSSSQYKLSHSKNHLPSSSSINMAPRAHSSLGFSRQISTESRAATPSGFDIYGYLRTHGAGSGVRIGVNGRSSRDEYFDSYLRECRRGVMQEEEEEFVSCESEEEDDVMVMSSFKGSGAKSVPLCWEDQLTKAEPDSIKTAYSNERHTYKCSIIHDHPPPTNSTTAPTPTPTPTNEERLQHLQDTLSVMISWRERWILKSTPLKELRGEKKDYIFTSSTLNITVPQPETLNQNDTLTELSQQQPFTEGGSSAITEDGSELTDHLLPSLLQAHTELGNEQLLCVWLKDSEYNIKEILQYSFEVFLTGATSKMFSPVDLIRVSETVAVIPLQLDSEQRLVGDQSEAVRLSLMSLNPRLLLFTARLKLSDGRCSHPAQKKLLLDSVETSSRQLHVESPEQERDISHELFFRKRQSYCNQEEDEDRTDMEVLAKNYPDLMVQDLVGGDNDDETTPFSSPVHGQHLKSLNTMATQHRGNSLQSRSLDVTLPGHSLPTREENQQGTKPNRTRPLYRPSSKDLKTRQPMKVSFATIVGHWLHPYVQGT